MATGSEHAQKAELVQQASTPAAGVKLLTLFRGLSDASAGLGRIQSEALKCLINIICEAMDDSHGSIAAATCNISDKHLTALQETTACGRYAQPARSRTQLQKCGNRSRSGLHY